MAVPEYSLVYAPRRILGSFSERVLAVQGEVTLLTASLHVFRSNARTDRKRAQKFVDKAHEKDAIIVKAEGYQIYVKANNWNRQILSRNDVIEILDQMVPFFKRKLRRLSDFKDISEEEYMKAYGKRDQIEKKRNRWCVILVGVVSTAILALIVSGYFIGFFGIIMLIAYAGDMFARR